MLSAKVPLFPEQASTVSERVDALFFYILGVTFVFTALIAFLVLYFAVKYRRRSEDEFPKPIVGSTKLEVAWCVVPLVLALAMFVWGAVVFVDIATPPEDSLEVYVVGRQWMWKLQHPGGQREINELHVPVGQPVKLIMTSEDVIHDLWVPDFRVKMDVLPGRYTRMWFEATKPGRYRLFCSEYCGTEHSRMGGWVYAMEPAEYEKWLSERADRSMALQGRNLFQKLDCVTCHSADAEARGPVLEALYNRRVALRGGRSALADENYLRESILEPDAKVVDGYRPIMPPYVLKKAPDDAKGHLTEEELLQLIAYLKALRPGETPPRVEESPPPDRTPDEKSKP
jgi:cytochrome c oxidase subunit 2